MTSEPDKLFHDKLQNYQRPVPPSAWERIERNVSKTRVFNTRIKLAATILLMVAAGYLMWPKSVSIETAHNVTEQKEVIQPSETINNEKEIVKSEEDKSIISPEPNQSNSITPIAITKPRAIGKKVSIDTEEKIREESIEQTIVSGLEKEELPVQTTLANQKDLSRKIVYSSEEVNERFLKEKIAPEVFVPKETKPTPKSKSLAYSIKHSDIGIGDLRQIKNEILTLDFLAQNDKNNKSTNR